MTKTAVFVWLPFSDIPRLTPLSMLTPLSSPQLSPPPRRIHSAIPSHQQNPFFRQFHSHCHCHTHKSRVYVYSKFSEHKAGVEGIGHVLLTTYITLNLLSSPLPSPIKDYNNGDPPRSVPPKPISSDHNTFDFSEVAHQLQLFWLTHANTLTR